MFHYVLNWPCECYKHEATDKLSLKIYAENLSTLPSLSGHSQYLPSATLDRHASLMVARASASL